MILILDNYDSFVYNLARYVGELDYTYLVKRNDDVSLVDIEKLNPTHIIISPGPCTPDEAGISLATVQTFGNKIPILGVCLGHQAIGQVYGGQVTRAKNPMHGKATDIYHDGTGIFSNLPSPLRTGRYHSLIIDPQLPAELKITARCADGEIMALQHQTHPVYGVQFHPESVLTQHGHQLLKNFLTIRT